MAGFWGSGSCERGSVASMQKEEAEIQVEDRLENARES